MLGEIVALVFSAKMLALIAIILLCFVAFVIFRSLQRLRRQKQKVSDSPLERNDVIDQFKPIHKLDLSNGVRNIANCTMRDSYPLSKIFDQEKSSAKISFRAGREEVSFALFGPGVKNIKLCLGDSPNDTNYFNKLEITQLSKVFGFSLGRDAEANFTAKHDGHPLVLTVKKYAGRKFFCIFGIYGKEKQRFVYFYGLYEVQVKAGLSSKYKWLQ